MHVAEVRRVKSGQPLDGRGLPQLRVILSEGGVPHADVTIESFFERITTHHQISTAVSLQALKARLEGLPVNPPLVPFACLAQRSLECLRRPGRLKHIASIVSPD